MHGSEQFPVVIGEFVGDVFGAHLLQDVGRSSFWTLLLLQGHLRRETETWRERKLKERKLRFWCTFDGLNCFGRKNKNTRLIINTDNENISALITFLLFFSKKRKKKKNWF